MINYQELKVKNYKTLTYKGFDISISPELLQDMFHKSIPNYEIENFIIKEFNKLTPLIRNKKIDLILS